MENNENGRSMIEMLGVLAIIGVLSVGGIMGYSKAMFRYKINKTIEQITYIAGNVRTAFANQGNYYGIDNAPRLWKKANFAPKDMWKADKEYPQHVWESGIQISRSKKNSADTNSNKAFSIDYYQIPEEACIELITHDWKNAQVKVIGVWQGDYYPARSYRFIPPAKLDDAVKICSIGNYLDVYAIIFYFDNDTSDSYWRDNLDASAAAIAGL